MNARVCTSSHSFFFGALPLKETLDNYKEEEEEEPP